MAHLKRALFAGEHGGEPLVSVINPGEKIKTAGLRPVVQAFCDSLKPCSDYTYALVNAMGYSEYYGANSNTDWYGYNPQLDFNGLLHAWPDIGRDIEADRMKSKAWPYGYPCFYNSTVYAHHKNTDQQQLGFGDVVFAAANPHMKRIELVMRVFNSEASKKGHTSILDRIRAGERVDVSMGCFKAGAMVSMADGTTKPIEDVVVGDRVRTHTGGTGRVTELHRRKYRGEFFEIKPANSDPLHATVEHPFFAAHGAKDAHRVWNAEAPEFEWRYAKDLDGAVLSRPKVTKTISPGRHWGWGECSPQEIRAFARLIGYYLAEGHVVFDKKEQVCGIELTVNKSDAVNQEVSDLCVTIGTRNDPVWRQRENSPDAWALQIYDKELALICVEYAGRYSKTKRLAEEVLYWPQELQLELLGAYGNGDGFASKDGSFSFSTSSSALASQVQEILFRLGIPTSHNVLTHKAGTGFSADTTEHVVFIGRQWAPRLRAFCAKVVVREVKKAKNIFKDYGNLWAVPIREYESYYDEADVYNFEVEGDNSYIVNGIAAHNCKVPFDLCSICTDWATVKKAWKSYNPTQHRHPGVAILAYHRKVAPIRGLAVTKADYCEHMRTQRGKVLRDGRKVFVYNDFPRFFDISFVWIGADRTARVMWHLAGDNPLHQPAPSIDEMVRRTFGSFFGKVAEMEKEIPDGIVEAVHLDADNARPLPIDQLEQLSMEHGPKSVLSTLSGLGIVPKPREFQTIVLARIEGGPLLRRFLDQKNTVFDTSAEGLDPGANVDADAFSDDLAQLFSHHMKERSCFAPFLNARMLRPRPKVAATQPVATRADVLDKIAAQYNSYRLSVLEQAPDLFPKVASTLDPSWLLEKEAGLGGLAALLLGMGPVVHLLSSHLRGKQETGSKLNPMSRFVAENPTFTTLTTVGGALRAAMEIERHGGLVSAGKKVLTTIAKATA